MSTAERATKRRRLSADKATTPAKSSGTAPESKSTGRSARSRTGVKADASEAVVLEVTPKTRRTPRASNAALENGNDQSDGNARTRTNGKAGSPATGQKKTPTAAGSARRRGGANAPNPSAVVVTAPAAEHERLPVPAIEVSPSEEDDANGSTSDEDEDADDAPVSRETFLHNEQLKRQREARNFVYEGDGNAPKLTRSGRVITAALPESENTALSAPDTPSRIAAHMNAGTARTPSRRAVLTEQGDTSIAASPAVALDATPSRTQAATPRGKKLSQRAALPEGAKKYLERTMAILTGAEDGTVSGPQPFDAEEGNETLRGLVNVLRGTVCRGEGNSALLVGPRGVGKSRTVARALQLLTNPPTQNDEPSRTVSPDIIDGIIPAMIPPPATSSASTIPPAPPIIVRLSGHAQTNDRLAIREMGRQIAWAEGHASFDDGVPEDEDQEYAPTTLPSHLLALLTAPSARAIVVIMEEFDLFTEHARQALLYCLLDVVQSIKTGPVESTGRGVALIGITSRTDTLLLLEKRVKSRFSHRVWRVTSPLAPGGLAVPEGDKAWKMLLRRALVPKVPTEQEEDAGTKRWLWDWEFAIDMLLKQDKIIRHFDRLSSLTTDVRNLYRPFIPLIPLILSDTNDFLSVPLLSQSLLAQVDGAGWGIANAKLKGLSQPALTILVAAKHLAYAGKDEFNFAQVNEEYVRFARTRLVGSGRVRWAEGVLRRAFDQVISLGLLVPVSNATIKPHFARYRCTLSTHEIVAWFKGEGASSLGPELGNWGRMMGGHA